MSPSDGSRLAKPEAVFDRDAKSDAVVAFACDARPRAGLGVVRDGHGRARRTSWRHSPPPWAASVSGRSRRARTESLRRLGDELPQYTGTSPPSHWHGWEDAVDALLVHWVTGSRCRSSSTSSPTSYGGVPLPSVIHCAYRRLRGAGRDKPLPACC